MDIVRKRVVEKLNRVTGDRETSQGLEIHLYNFTLERCSKLNIKANWKEPRLRSIYVQKAMSIIFNITNTENPGLLARVMDPTTSLREIVHAHPAALFPKKWDALYEAAAARLLKKLRTNDAENSPDGAFQCSRCKSMKTVYAQLQTRSADEPLTTFITCLKCEKRWKF